MLKRTVSLRRFFWLPTTYVLDEKIRKLIFKYVFLCRGLYKILAHIAYNACCFLGFFCIMSHRGIPKKGCSSSAYNDAICCSPLRLGVLYYTIFLCRIMIILSIFSSDTCFFRPQWRHNPYKYFDFCGRLNPRMRLAPLALQHLMSLTVTPPSIPKKDAQIAHIRRQMLQCKLTKGLELLASSVLCLFLTVPWIGDCGISSSYFLSWSSVSAVT